MSSKYRDKGRGKAVDRSTAWSDWIFDYGQRRYYQWRFGPSGIKEYNWDNRRSETQESSYSSYSPRESTVQTQQTSPWGSSTASRAQLDPAIPSQENAAWGPGTTTRGPIAEQNSSQTPVTATAPYLTAFDSGRSLQTTQDVEDSDIVPRYTAPTSATSSTRWPSAMGPQTVPQASMGIPFNSAGNYTIDAVTESFGKTSISGPAPAKNAPYVTRHVVANDPESSYERLDLRYQVVREGSRFFKIGRVFKILWPEPKGAAGRDDDEDDDAEEEVISGKYGEEVFVKIRPLVVVREQNGCCLCLPLTTHRGQGTLKHGINPRDFAAVYDENKPRGPKLAAGERMDKQAFPVKIEDKREKLDPMTRLNFARIYTVEHNVKVLKVGIIRERKAIQRLQQYFVESIAGPGFTVIPSDIQSTGPQPQQPTASGNSASGSSYSSYPPQQPTAPRESVSKPTDTPYTQPASSYSAGINNTASTATVNSYEDPQHEESSSVGMDDNLVLDYPGYTSNTGSQTRRGYGMHSDRYSSGRRRRDDIQRRERRRE